MSKEIVINDETERFDMFNPQTEKEMWKLAENLSRSSFVPKQFVGKPFDIMLIMEYGKDLGLKPLQALQNMACINGKPGIYGDAMLAVVQSNPKYEWHEETIIDGVARCVIKRKGSPECVYEFSIKDATTAKLWKKVGPWSDHPYRMLQMRARAFCCRNSFADALMGISCLEELEDFDIVSQDVQTVPHGQKAAASKIDLLLKKKKSVPKAPDLDVDIVTGEIVEHSIESPPVDLSMVIPPIGASNHEFDADVKELHRIINEHKISPTIIQGWMDSGNASSLSELKHKTIKALIKKYDKDEAKDDKDEEKNSV